MIAPDTQHFESLSLPVISVVVCTYNRADLLADALQTLSEQSLNLSEYEVIVVDNNSKDNTRAITQEFYRRYPNFHYCFEPRQGISHARNRGWQKSRGEYVAYVDDDCRMPKRWLTVAMEVINQVSPDVFGGPYFACYNTHRPRWFKSSYGSHKQGNKARTLNKNEHFDLHEGNIVLRRMLFDTVGAFDTSFGPVGRKMGYGEGARWLKRMHATLPDQVVYYDPRFYVYHLVRPEKMTMWWNARSFINRGRYCYRVFSADAFQPAERYTVLMLALRKLVALAVNLARNLFHRDRTRYPYIQNYLYEETFRQLAQLGSLYEKYRQIVQQPYDRV